MRLGKILLCKITRVTKYIVEKVEEYVTLVLERQRANLKRGDLTSMCERTKEESPISIVAPNLFGDL